MIDTIKKVGVIGSGLMGSGIAQIVAAAGFDVVLCDVDLAFVEKGVDSIAKNLKRAVDKGKLTAEEMAATLGRIAKTADYNQLADVDMIFEAVSEKTPIKTALYEKIGKICKPECIFATNTSGLSITEIAAASGRSDRFIGAHFFNPAPVMKLCEVIRGYDTTDQTHDITVAMCQKIGKETISVKEAPLFCVNRILVPMINEAVFVLMEGIASAEDIDKGMCLGSNQPIGPLALADLIGLDTLLLVIETLYRETGDSKYRPCPLLVKMVRGRHYGRKTGQGFYKYD